MIIIIINNPALLQIKKLSYSTPTAISTLTAHDAQLLIHFHINLYPWAEHYTFNSKEVWVNGEYWRSPDQNSRVFPQRRPHERLVHERVRSTRLHAPFDIAHTSLWRWVHWWEPARRWTRGWAWSSRYQHFPARKYFTMYMKAHLTFSHTILEYF